MNFDEVDFQTFKERVLKKFYIETFGLNVETLSQIPGLVYVASAGGSVLQVLAGKRWETDIDLYTANQADFGLLEGFLATIGYLKTQEFQNEDRGFAYQASGFMARNKLHNISTFENVRLSTSIQIILTNESAVMTAEQTVRNVIDNFDLSICSFAYEFLHAGPNKFYKSPNVNLQQTFEKNEMILNTNYVDLYSKSNYILHKRVLKYENRGYTLLNRPPLTLSILNVNKAIARLEQDKGYFENVKFAAFYVGFQRIQEGFLSLPSKSHEYSTVPRDWWRRNIDPDYETSARSLDEIDQRIALIDNKIQILVEKRERYRTGEPLLFQSRIDGFESRIKYFEKILDSFPITLQIARDDFSELYNRGVWSPRFNDRMLADPDFRTQIEPLLNLIESGNIADITDCSNADDYEIINQEELVRDIRPEKLFKNVIFRRDPVTQIDRLLRVQCYDAFTLQQWIHVERRQRNDVATFPDTRARINRFQHEEIRRLVHIHNISLRIVEYEKMLVATRQKYSDYLDREEDSKFERAFILAGGDKGKKKTRSKSKGKTRSKTKKNKRIRKSKSKSSKSKRSRIRNSPRRVAKQ
jgi:hypothetical protein